MEHEIVYASEKSKYDTLEVQNTVDKKWHVVDFELTTPEGVLTKGNFIKLQLPTKTVYRFEDEFKGVADEVVANYRNK